MLSLHKTENIKAEGHIFQAVRKLFMVTLYQALRPQVWNRGIVLLFL
jgi:hypothetical protein